MDTLIDWPYRISINHPGASVRLAAQLYGYMKQLPPNQRIAIVCIGTDRSTGDSLGPLVGSSLRKFRSTDFEVYGTLQEPVHAMNLDDTLNRVYTPPDHPFVIAVDACLGSSRSVGSVIVAEGPLRPGAGVGKNLTPVGDIHLSGVVNLGGFMELVMLQSTRLYLVTRMAELISRSLHIALTIMPRQNASPTLPEASTN